MTTTTYSVTGMTCDHCCGAVTAELGKLDGVREIDIDLVAGGTSTIQVVSNDTLDLTAVREAVDEAGYELVDSA